MSLREREEIQELLRSDGVVAAIVTIRDLRLSTGSYSRAPLISRPFCCPAFGLNRARATLLSASRMKVLRLSLLAVASAALLICSGCADFEEAQKQAHADAMKTAQAAPRAMPGYWNGDDASGAPKIVIHLHEQRAYFYKGGHVVGESSISTGRKGFETPPGKYRVIQKDEHHVSNLYGDYVNKDGEIVERNVDATKDPQPKGTEFQGAKMPYFLRFTRGYGMHAGYVPRYRASHGCIRMPAEMAKHFFDAADEETPVIVKE